MEAKEMFEGAGYIQEIEKYRIIYTNDTFMGEQYHIWFDLKYKTIEVWHETENVWRQNEPFEINLQELQAINKQVEELWGENNEN